jgi:hypothetical protein
MYAAAGARARMERATLASLGIHLLVALAIPALAWTASTAAPVETISFAHVLHVEIRRLSQPPPRAAAPHHDTKQSVNFAHHVRLVTRTLQRNASPAPAFASNAPAAPAVATLQRAGTGSSDSNGVPNVTPSPAVRDVASVGTRREGGYLPFGAEQPDPVLDPGIRKQLEALGAHVTLVVTVGEDGRTEDVAFNPPIDPQLESRIRSLLADASWDPAVCGGGVSCEAQATIKL